MKRKLINTISIIVIVISVLTISVCALLMWRPFKEQGNRYTLTGSGSKAISSAQEWNGDYSNFLVTGIDKTNKLTDVIMIVSFDNKTGKISVLQIPRDTYAGKDVVSKKYNAIYGHPPKGVSGMDNLVAHVERDFGIKINHYAAITTKGLDNLVDSVGGVDLYVPINMNYDDKYQDLHIHLKKGYQHLNGNQAEQFVRFRKGWPQGDIGRLQAQKSFLATFASKLKQQNIIALTTKVLPTLMPPNFKTDMSNLELIQFGLAAKKIDMNKVKVFTMPGEDYTDPKTKLSYYMVHKDELLQVINANFMEAGQALSETDLGISELERKYNSSPYTKEENFENIYNSQISKSK